MILEEGVDDYNNKYSGSVGIIYYRYSGKKSGKEYSVTKPFLIDHTDGTFMYGSILNRRQWNSKSIKLNTIDNITFPFPYLGYVLMEGYWPCYISRNAIRQYHRGWSGRIIDIAYSPIISDLSYAVQRFEGPRMQPLHQCTQAELVDFCFGNNTDRFKKMDEVNIEDDMFALLSKDFLGVNTEDGWILLYKNNFVGTLFPLNFVNEVDFLKDKFMTEVA